MDTDIAIVGGGLNGPALALALAQGGLGVTIIDALPLETLVGSGFDGRAYAIAHASRKMLKALGVWGKVEHHSQPILDIIASDGRPGEGASPWNLHFDHQELEEGPMGHMIEDRFLRRALLAEVAKHPNIQQINSCKVVGQQVHPDFAELVLENGKTVRTKLIAGCDGRQSDTAIRAGIARTGWEYNQTGLVSSIAHELPHNGIAHQFFMPSGPLGILPLPGNICSIVWAETSERAKRITALSDNDYLIEFRPCFGDFLGKIKLVGGRFSYPLRLTIANSFVADRLVLVGDAAHGLHPLAGQGLNMGFRDIAALAEVLILSKRRGEDISSPLVLNRYEEWRRFDTTSMAVATNSINALFSNDNGVLRFIRDAGLGVVNSLPSVRRGLMRQAAGLSGDLPRLMQGLAI